MSFYKEVPGRKTTLESTLKFDTTPTAGSTNPVTSDGVAEALGMSVSQQYVPGKTYEIGAIVTHDGGLYINNYGTISDTDWVEEHWTPTSVGELIVSGMCEADKMQVIAVALNDLDARLKAVEESISSVNIGSRIADEIDTQSLKVGGEDINDIIQNAIGG
jgi:hypothetical protein